MKPYLLLVLFCLFGLTSMCQDTLRYHAFSLRHDNDINFFTDCYFTSGVELKGYLPVLSKSPINYLLLPSMEGALTIYALTVTHHMYTPKKLFTPNIMPFDHPYASYILFGQVKESYQNKEKIKITSSFELGVIGSLAGGEVIQSTLHQNISIADPAEGWHNQIQNDLCIQYSATLEKGWVSVRYFEFISKLNFQLGVPHTQVALGAQMRFGKGNSYFRGPGTLGLFRWQCWGFVESNVHVVRYNAVLQGGFFNESNKHTLYNVKPVYVSFRYGVMLVHRKWSVRYAVNINSPTFSTALWHHWADLTLAWAF